MECNKLSDTTILFNSEAGTDPSHTKKTKVKFKITNARDATWASSKAFVLDAAHPP